MMESDVGPEEDSYDPPAALSGLDLRTAELHGEAKYISSARLSSTIAGRNHLYAAISLILKG
jgi:hypothetical protein